MTISKDTKRAPAVKTPTGAYDQVKAFAERDEQERLLNVPGPSGETDRERRDRRCAAASLAASQRRARAAEARAAKYYPRRTNK